MNALHERTHMDEKGGKEEKMDITILLADDSKLVQAKFRLALEKAGFQVISALDGKEGLSIAREKKPDLIILDVNMPGMDGWQVLRSLKIHPELRKIPVIMATTADKIADIERGFSLGAKEYVVKDEQLTRLVDKVEKVMASQKPETKVEGSWVKKMFS